MSSYGQIELRAESQESNVIDDLVLVEHILREIVTHEENLSWLEQFLPNELGYFEPLNTDPHLLQQQLMELIERKKLYLHQAKVKPASTSIPREKPASSPVAKPKPVAASVVDNEPEAVEPRNEDEKKQLETLLRAAKSAKAVCQVCEKVAGQNRTG